MPFPTKAIRDKARKRVGQRVKAGEPCWFCKAPIDLTIPYPAPGSFTVDHATPTSLGGSDDYDLLRPAHNRCNRQRSNLPDGTVGRNSGALDRVGEVPSATVPEPSHSHRDQSGAPITPRSRKASP